MSNNANCLKASFVQEQAQIVRSFCRSMMQAVTGISGGGSQFALAPIQVSEKATEQYSCRKGLISFAPEDNVDEMPPEFITNDLLPKLNKTTLERIATYPTTPHSVLEILAKHDHADVRGAVSENANASDRIIWALAGDHDPTVRYQLAENPHLPFAVLESLSNDDNTYVACRAQTTIARIFG